MLSIVRAESLAAAVQLINSHPLEQWCGLLHVGWGPPRVLLRAAIEVGHGGHQCADSGSHGLAFLRRLEALAVGRASRYGEEALRFYTRYKSVMQRWPEDGSRGPDFTMPVN